MPVKSAAQQRLMYAAIHGDTDKVPKKVALHFIKETPKAKRKEFARGK